MALASRAHPSETDTCGKAHAMGLEADTTNGLSASSIGSPPVYEPYSSACTKRRASSARRTSATVTRKIGAAARENGGGGTLWRFIRPASATKTDFAARTDHALPLGGCKVDVEVHFAG